MTDRTLECGDATIRYRADGDGPAVVLLHGWTLDLEVWESQAAALARTLRVVRYDRRGFGGSGGSPDPARDTDDLAALLDRLGIAQATLVGMSQGARVALAFALRRPERVAALVLDGPPDCFGGGEPDADGDRLLAPFRELAREKGVDAFRAAWRAHPLMQLRREDAAARALLDRMVARYPGTDLLEPAARGAPSIELKALARLAMPVLIMNGEFESPARRRTGERLHEALPNAEHVLLPDAGHLANLDNPVAYNGALGNFLRRQLAAAA